MIRSVCLAAMLAFSACAAQAETPSLTADLSPIGFLLGQWNSGKGTVADTGGSSTGSSTISAEANGAAMIRRDHTNLFDSQGKATGSFEQVMMIYAQDGGLHADYTDGQHVIHYTSAQIVPGKSVTFISTPEPGQPVFHLNYDLASPQTLDITFSIEPPGQTAFRTIAQGTLSKAP